MIENPVIKTMLEHRSIRSYADRTPSDEVVETVVRAGQQAPFAYQIYSVLLSRKREKNPFKAPLLFTICVDFHKFERIMAKRGWKRVTNDLTMLMFGIEDASYMAQNMVVAARSLGLGTCFLGGVLANPSGVAKQYKLPKHVYPIVQLAMGYPAEEPPTRPRYPLDFVLFEDEYPKLNDATIARAMKVMDEGYLAQDYYRKAKLIIPLQRKRKETYTFKDYSWTEHISRKLGLWHDSQATQRRQLAKRGFVISDDK
jgi:FMN reductase (NADPH)